MTAVLTANKPRAYYVFVDNSNLIIQAFITNLLSDGTVDPRTRVELSKLLALITGNSGMCVVKSAALFGSEVSPTDSVWEAAKRRNFSVNVFCRSSITKGEKQVDSAMVAAITECAVLLGAQGQPDGMQPVIAVLSGDLDMLPAVEMALKYGVPVELWSWKACLNAEFIKFRETHGMEFSIKFLDAHKDEFTYTAYHSTRPLERATWARALVLENVQAGVAQDAFQIVITVLHDLKVVFYVHKPIKRRDGAFDVVVEFVRVSVRVVFPKIVALLEHLYAGQRVQVPDVVAYTVYEQRKHAPAKPKDPATENSFASLVVKCAADIAAQVKLEEEEQSAGMPTWKVVSRQDMDKKEIKIKKKLTACKFGVHCKSRGRCGYSHSNLEQETFTNPAFAKINFLYYKTRACGRLDSHSAKNCAFVHDLVGEKPWCGKCHVWGHYRGIECVQYEVANTDFYDDWFDM